MESGGGRGSGGTGRVGGKKMRKRKELDALVGGGGKRPHGKRRRPPDQQLLSDSTEDDDYWPPPPAKPHHHIKGRCEGSKGRVTGCRRVLLRLCAGLTLGACAVTTVTVIWLFIDIRQQTAFLRSQLDQVAAGSQGVPDAFQKCHSMSRQLQTNQTIIFTQLSQFSQGLENITNQINIVESGLEKVRESVTSSSDMTSVTVEVRSLASSVAQFGSQIQDIQASVQRLDDRQASVATDLELLRTNITLLNATVVELFKHLHPVGESDGEKKNDRLIAQLNDTFTALNDSVYLKMKWMGLDEKSDHASIEDLKEVSANFSSRLTTLKNECNSKQAVIDSISSGIANLTFLYTQGSKRIKGITENMHTLNQRVALTENSSLAMISQIDEIKKNVINQQQKGTSPITPLRGT